MKSEESTFSDLLTKKGFPFGYVQTELDHFTAANGPSLPDRKVFYFIRPASSPQAPYIVFFNGGPGMAASEMYLNYNYESFLPHYNVIFFDQRGTGLSFRPSDNLDELRYFSARQIAWDAELIRHQVLGKENKWIVFGQSYGGVIVRKFLEQFPNSVVTVITHGAGIYDGAAVAIGTEMGLMARWKTFFKSYPTKQKLLEELTTSLTDDHEMVGPAYKLSGKSLIHLLAILFTVISDDDMNQFLQALDPSRLAESFLEKITRLGELVLATGNLNRVVAFIDLLNGKTDEEVNLEVIPAVTQAAWYKKELPSKIALESALVPVSEDFFKLEKMFQLGAFAPDGPDMAVVSENVLKFKIDFHIYGSEEDVLAFERVKKEQLLTSKFNNDRLKYRYSQGHHREWLTNPDLFRDCLLVQGRN